MPLEFFFRAGSEPAAALSAEDAVRTYKRFQQVEQAFRCLKGLDLHIRPIHHRTEDHVRAHIFLRMLAYYVEWHLRKDLAPVLFQDEELDNARWTRDPVAKAEASQSATEKKKTKTTEDGRPVHSWPTLLADMATRTQNQCRAGKVKNTIRFELMAEPTSFQKHVFGLAGVQPRRAVSSKSATKIELTITYIRAQVYLKPVPSIYPIPCLTDRSASPWSRRRKPGSKNGPESVPARNRSGGGRRSVFRRGRARPRPG